MRNIFVLLGFIILVETVGIIGAYFTSPAIPGWYASLIKPPFSPPNWLFGPAWTFLYALMGISLFLVWKSKGKQKNKALKLFWLQLGVNFLWSILFFGLKSPLLGLVDIFLLIYLIIRLINANLEVNRVSAYILFPYLAWVMFATILNLSIVVLN